MLSNSPHNHMNQINPNPTQLPHCKYLQTSHVAPGQIDSTYTKSHKTTKTTTSNQPEGKKAVSIQSETANLLTQRSPRPPPQPFGKPCTQSPEKTYTKTESQNHKIPTQPNTKRGFWKSTQLPKHDEITAPALSSSSSSPAAATTTYRPMYDAL